MRLCLALLVLAASAPVRAADIGAPDGPDLSGTWRVDLRLTHQAQVPLLGQVDIESRQVNLAVVEAGRDGWVQRHEPCDLQSSSPTALAVTTFPPRFIAAIPRKEYPVSVSGEAGAWTYHADYGFHAVGFDAALSPSGMPTQVDHPSVRDVDADGQPGATIEVHVPVIGTVEVYLVQQAHTVVDGLVKIGADGRVEEVGGSLAMLRSGQQTLDASNRLFAQTPKVKFQPTMSGFTMERLATGTTCASLMFPPS
jgi:hypothetical protein